MAQPASQKTRSTMPTTVALVDCYASLQLFVGDDTFRAMCKKLAQSGIEAMLLDLVRDEPPPGKAIGDVLAALRAAAPELVIVSRAWNEELLGALREAAGASVRMVRFSHGAPSAIDSCFDAIVDADGINAIIGGELEVEAPHWRRSRSEMAVGQPGSAAAAATRPTISGPAKGCPFLVDVRTSPAYRDSGIDFDRVQSKGCAFCLDNVGAFAAFSEDAVIEAWLSQLRCLRQQDPTVREVLLTDERPHPYLPALFRAVLADPALHGIELLIKSRVDWLAEYADTALHDACELAAQSHSILNLYLVGFESFHQPDLDLFNKAVTVDQNVEAIELLHALAARHPISFEFRRHTAHGIVLFHPWSTPQSLLDNARIMRTVRFHELRTEALRTRLRLYRSVPLHALAERQGLLTGHFSEERGDRAVEQGYDASVPWQFADARIEAIYVAANRLAEALPQLLEPDVLELATHFVLRWPAFSQAPELAALPILNALYCWGSSPADVLAVAGPVLAGFDREVEAVAAERKLACLKEAISQEEAEDLVRAYGVMGLAAAIVSAHARGGDDGRHQKGASHVIVAVACDSSVLERVVSHQRALESGERSHIAQMGNLMGYPSCCVAEFERQPEQGNNLNLERVPFRAHPERSLHKLISRFGAVRLISHMLCSPDCQPSIELTAVTIAALEAIDAAATRRIVEHLAQPILRLDYRRALLVDGAWEAESYRVRQLQPLHDTDLGFDARRVRQLRLSNDRVSFGLDDGTVETVAATLPMLVEPGKSVGPAMRRLIEDARLASILTPRAEAATGGEETPAVDLAVVFAPQTRVESYVIVDNVADDAYGVHLTLLDGTSSLRVHVHPWQPQRPAFSRRGRWALDCDSSELSAAERSAVGNLARLLPAGDRNGSAAHANARSIRASQAQGRGVVCTAPWTTLEVVDPDGRARQCCADWTVGDRGNVHRVSLTDIWNGDGYRMARRIMSGSTLSPLCRTICPRLYDFKFAERELSITAGASRFMENQRLLIEDVEARREVVRGKPLYVAVCPSTYCNYNCIMCLHGRSPRRELPEFVWQELLAMLPTLRVLTLLGGEPLANPLAMKFLRSWDRAQYPDAAVSLITNGSLLGAQVLKHLQRCRFGSVTISLNAGTSENYAHVQRGIEFDEVLANVDALIEFRRLQNADFPIILSFVVQPANHFTLLEFARIAHQRGLGIRLMPLSPRGPEGLDYYGDTDAVACVLESLDALALWARETAPSYIGEIDATRAAIAAEAAGRDRLEAAQAVM